MLGLCGVAASRPQRVKSDRPLYGEVGKFKDSTGRLKQITRRFRSSLDLSAFAKRPASRISRVPPIRCATKGNIESERSGSTLLKAAALPQCSGTNWRRGSSDQRRASEGVIQATCCGDAVGSNCVVKCVVKLAQSRFWVGIEFEEFARFYGQKSNILPVKSAWEISEPYLWSQSCERCRGEFRYDDSITSSRSRSPPVALPIGLKIHCRRARTPAISRL